MKKEPKKANEAQLLELLKRVLPKATHDPKLADKIYGAVENELKATARVTAFEKFCQHLEIPDLEPKSIEEVKRQLTQTFGDGDVTVRPNKKEKTLTVELALTDGAQFTGEVRVNPNATADQAEEEEFKPKFAPFPVAMPGDKELVWILAKHETLSPEEAGIALSKIEEEFWASKSGQKLLRDRVERSFPEFISRVPAKLLTEVGLKRHYKTPEPIKVVRSGAQAKAKAA
ncbi:MAG TPA: hypothetical protein VEH04_05265 [Verrucomicrobiae bacterium]|nr:hypothetical protein [Verrucomicrobiae bacterium]